MSRPTRELATRGAERDPQARRFEVRIVTIGKTPRRTLTYHATVTAENESAAAAASILDMVELERAAGRPVTPGEAFRADVDDGAKTWHMVAQFAPPGHRPARRQGRGSTYDDRAREEARDANRQEAVERDARFAATERNGTTAVRGYLVHIVEQHQPNGPAQQIDWERRLEAEGPETAAWNAVERFRLEMPGLIGKSSPTTWYHVNVVREPVDGEDCDAWEMRVEWDAKRRAISQDRDPHPTIH